jgi:hypothetical protein
VLDHVVPHVIAHALDIPVRPPQQPLHPVRRDLARSASVQPFFRSRPATSPETYSGTRGSERENRPAIRSCSRSSSATTASITDTMIHYVINRCSCSTSRRRVADAPAIGLPAIATLDEAALAR